MMRWMKNSSQRKKKIAVKINVEDLKKIVIPNI